MKSGLAAALALFVLLWFARSGAGQRPIGKVAQTLRDVGIHSKMDASSHVYYRAKQFEYLVVRAAKSPSWVQVVLQNGTVGYVPADAVAILPYPVMDKPKTPVSTLHASVITGKHGTVRFKVRLANQSKKKIVAIEILAEVYDVFDDPVMNPAQYPANNVFECLDEFALKPGWAHTATFPMILFDRARKVKNVSLSRVKFADGSEWSPARE